MQPTGSPPSSARGNPVYRRRRSSDHRPGPGSILLGDRVQHQKSPLARGEIAGSYFFTAAVTRAGTHELNALEQNCLLPRRPRSAAPGEESARPRLRPGRTSAPRRREPRRLSRPRPRGRRGYLPGDGLGRGQLERLAVVGDRYPIAGLEPVGRRLAQDLDAQAASAHADPEAQAAEPARQSRRER
jgi:hypothetical protein